MEKYLDDGISALLAEKFRNSQKRLILLDYDGTLVPFNCDPSRALPDERLLRILHHLSKIENVNLVIISGRNRQFLDSIFSDLNAAVFAEHGAVYRLNGQWEGIENDLSWRDEIIAVMHDAEALTPGSSIEIKENSVVWHYRKSDSDLAHANRARLIEKLTPPCSRANLTILRGRKIIEVKPSDYTKGTAIMNFFDCSIYDFILAAGDDKTDEDLFKALPQEAVTVHVGKSPGISTYTIRNSDDFVAFLDSLTI